MLCTDGLHGSITDTVIALHLNQKGSLEAKADKLVKRVLSAGGQDNVTIVLAAMK
jgi:serine/threonine protein phosphatase PrpC